MRKFVYTITTPAMSKISESNASRRSEEKNKPTIHDVCACDNNDFCLVLFSSFFIYFLSIFILCVFFLFWVRHFYKKKTSKTCFIRSFEDSLVPRQLENVCTKTCENVESIANNFFQIELYHAQWHFNSTTNYHFIYAN